MSLSVFILFYQIDGDSESLKIIGIFDSEESASNAIDVVKNKSGFSDGCGEFIVDEYIVNKINWKDGFGV